MAVEEWVAVTVTSTCSMTISTTSLPEVIQVVATTVGVDDPDADTREAGAVMTEVAATDSESVAETDAAADEVADADADADAYADAYPDPVAATFKVTPPYLSETALVTAE